MGVHILARSETALGAELLEDSQLYFWLSCLEAPSLPRNYLSNSRLFHLEGCPRIHVVSASFSEGNFALHVVT